MSKLGLFAISGYLPEEKIENKEIIERFGFQNEFLIEKIGIFITKTNNFSPSLHIIAMNNNYLKEKFFCNC